MTVFPALVPEKTYIEILYNLQCYRGGGNTVVFRWFVNILCLFFSLSSSSTFFFLLLFFSCSLLCFRPRGHPHGLIFRLRGPGFRDNLHSYLNVLPRCIPHSSLSLSLTSLALSLFLFLSHSSSHTLPLRYQPPLNCSFGFIPDDNTDVYADIDADTNAAVHDEHILKVRGGGERIRFSF